MNRAGAVGARRRIYRILALAIVFFAAGGWFWWDDWSVRHSAGERVTAPAAVQQTAPSRPLSQSPLAHFPAPAAFRTFSYSQDGMVSSTFAVQTVCVNRYLTFLVFPASVDYREDPSRAVLNRAFPCTPGVSFSYPVTKNELGVFPAGDYYLIVADQGTEGTWYNPR